MGIKDLYNVIKAECPYEIREAHLSEFNGYRIAIDISIFLYRYVRSAGPVAWMNSFILLLCTLKRNGVKCICIFDGDEFPDEKLQEQESRRAESKKAVYRLEECRRIRNLIDNEYMSPDSDDVPQEIIEECKLLIGTKSESSKLVDYTDLQGLMNSMNEIISRLDNQTMPITQDCHSKAMEIVKAMGISCFRAKGEAEALCSLLAVTGQVDGVLTEDTDVLAYGTPLMLSFKDFKLQDQKVHYIHYESLLESMDMKSSEFTDLCILLSCDYNSRVKGYPPDGKNRKKSVGIGAVGAVSMIREYRSLEEVDKHVDDISPLKYQRCREIFNPHNHNQNIRVSFNEDFDIQLITDIIESNRLSIKPSYVYELWKTTELQFQIEQSGFEEDNPNEDLLVKSEEVSSEINPE